MNTQKRRFLKAMAAGGVTYAVGRTLGTTFGQMSGVSGFSDYKALVCLFLFGGNDSWNMLVPTSTAEYNAYAKSRGAGTSASLAVDKDVLLPISPKGSIAGDATYGFHPKLPELRELFSAGKLAILPNVGPLIRPTTKEQYRTASAIKHELPPQLFSHNDQQDQWHSLRGNLLLRTGWAGRVADLLAARSAAQQLPINISLFGQTLFQAATKADPYVMGINGVNVFEGLNVKEDVNGYNRAAARRENLDGILSSTLKGGESNYYHRGYARVHERALKYADVVNDALSSSYNFASLPNSGVTLTPLATQFRTVAKMISQRTKLSMSRQIFLVAAGGFDTHDTQATDQPKLFADVSRSIKAFHDAMVEIGMSEQVTLFTQSDFGRTLTSNGDGSDHAWGGLQLVVGGSVKGGSMYGDYPLLAMDGPLEVGSGSFIPTIATDQYAATLARWFGVEDADLSAIAPHIANFTNRNLGFLI
jgi:uncharacterized protein (DUF1501 family)